MPLSYCNPVWDGYLADPFVFRAGDVWYAVGTGEHEAADAASGHPGGVAGERVIPLLRSHDFVHWTFVHDCLIRPDPALGREFWAPSVAQADGRFYLYYSVGPGHQLRVAVSEHPEGPYQDSGRPLMPPGRTPFAIDTHPFQDDDGAWYLFYARDFLDLGDEVRAGTALVVDRLVDMVALADDERTVLRARWDWQRFLADRPMYGQIWDWHTLEGACVVRHGGRYWCFYSGACYGNESYGVDYAVADSVLGPYDDHGGEGGPRVLRTIPGQVSGPGHNAHIVGPDGVSEYLVYHAWNAAGTKRQMYLDRLAWTDHGPRCLGPTTTPQVVLGT